jgi:hypothetical protein
MQQADQLFGPIAVTSPTTFTLPYDSSHFDAFSIPMGAPPAVNICAQVVPIGEVNETLQSATVNILP